MDIKSLPQDVRDYLRSGANIQSIAQCITELVLNSLDAKATAIAVRVNLLTFRIQVVDNGIGVSQPNMRVIGLQHMTSKCRSLADLNKIKQYGYRGEALASIAKMSKNVNITSRPKDTENTYSKTYENGKWSKTESVKLRAAQGTTVTVSEFMHNFPVRQKRVNKNFDLEETKKNMEALAIIHPKITFSLRNDGTGNVILQSKQASSVIQAIFNFYPDILINEFVEMKVSKGKISVAGLIYKQSHSSSRLQFLYVNKRPIVSQKIQKLLGSLLHNICLKNEHPVYCLNISCPCTIVDLTLSPRKTMVEFKNWDIILKCLEKGMRATWKDKNLMTTSQHSAIVSKKSVSLNSKFGVSVLEGVVVGKRVKRNDPESEIPLAQSDPSKVVEIDDHGKQQLSSNKHYLRIQGSKKTPAEIQRYCPTVTDSMHDQQKGKGLILNMFLKSTVAFPVNEPDKTNTNIKVNHNTMTMTLYSMKNVIQNSHIIRTSKNKQMVSKCMQTTMMQQEDVQFQSNYHFPIVRTNFTKCAQRTHRSYFVDNNFGNWGQKDIRYDVLNCQYSPYFNRNPEYFIDDSLLGRRSENAHITYDYNATVQQTFWVSPPSYFTRGLTRDERVKGIISPFFKNSLLIQNEDLNKNLQNPFSIRNGKISKMKRNLQFFGKQKPNKANKKGKKQKMHITIPVNRLSPAYEDYQVHINHQEQPETFLPEPIGMQNIPFKLFPEQSKSHKAKPLLQLGPPIELHPNLLSNHELQKIKTHKKRASKKKERKRRKCIPRITSTAVSWISHHNKNRIENTFNRNLCNSNFETINSNMLTTAPIGFRNGPDMFPASIVMHKDKSDENNSFMQCSLPAHSYPLAADKVETIENVEDKTWIFNQNGPVDEEWTLHNFNWEENKYIRNSNSRQSPVFPISNSYYRTVMKDERETKEDNSGNLIYINQQEGKTSICNPQCNDANPAVILENEWMQQEDRVGNKFFINKRTGMTSIFSPKTTNSFKVTKRIDFVPKGSSPALFKTIKFNGSLTPCSKKELLKALIKCHEDELGTIKWSNYIQDGISVSQFFTDLYEEKSKQVVNAIQNVSVAAFPRAMIKTFNNLQPQSFAKDLFLDLDIIGQLDKKFIVTFCQSTQLVILFDQHAVSERIRLENLLKDYKENERFRSTKCNIIAVDVFSGQDLIVLDNFKKYFETLGFLYKIQHKTLEITHMPLCIWSQLKKNDERNLRRLIISLINEQIDGILSTRGISLKKPTVIQNVINMEACRGAIKFGKPLSIQESETLIKELSMCQLPFQCAHGRPTLSPIIDLQHNNTLRDYALKPNLKILKSYQFVKCNF
ncbi:DNA mismatch repair protein Mlh3-like isoform X2 [Photinus pyralis]|uniref:DNA mismatch repair protein Mlh3-like isoform X2 n=1 Tax=Photinus pyralis TaxID=7054 RepID=UPI0012671D38|nr:DNA mismatch repair protein Mlh3-like isoform X2 [Photinus pyralis]